MSDPLPEKTALDTLAEEIMVLVSMRADENRLGCDGRLSAVDEWYDHLSDVVNDALDVAYERAQAVSDANR